MVIANDLYSFYNDVFQFQDFLLNQHYSIHLIYFNISGCRKYPDSDLNYLCIH